MTQDRDPFKAGLFVIAGLLLSLAVIVTIADFSKWTQQHQTIAVSFTLRDGLHGIRQGSVVSIGDQPVGFVASIGDHIEDGRIIGKTATLDIPKHYNIANDAIIDVVKPIFGTGSTLNITSVGHGQPYVYEQSPAIATSLASSAIAKHLINEMGIGDQQREDLRQSITNIRDASGELRKTLPTLADKLNSIAAKIEPLAAKAGPAMEDASASLANVKDITTQFRAKTPDWTKRVDTITQHTQETVTTARDLLKDKDKEIRASVDNVHAITANFREKTMAQVDQAVERGSSAMENLRKSSLDLRGMIVGQRPVIERALANAELTTDQLKLAAVEVRRSPWRLMYKPDDKELETDNLYDAARSFALAASTLDAASESLKAVAADKDNPEQVVRVLDHLKATFEQYEVAEKAFWDALKNRTPGDGTAGTTSR